MHPVRRQSLVEQTAAHLRDGFRSGRWSGYLPGVLRLASELGVSKDTVRGALHQLEAEGSLQDSGAGKRRKIVSRRGSPSSQKTLRVAVLPNERLGDENSHSQQLLLGIQHAIESAGHVCVLTNECLSRLGHKRERVARLVKATQADAWIVYAGTQDELEWFASQKKPVFALGGRHLDLPIASTRTDLSLAIENAVHTLVGHGHRRVVMICHDLARKPSPGPVAGAFLSSLKAHGLSAADYNLPDWDETAEGLEKLLEELFFATPPTALLFLEPSYCAAALAFLAQRGLQVPRDVSLISMLPDPVFALRRPPLAHFRWPLDEHIRHIALWVASIASGTEDHTQKIFPATFDPGGTIGPAKT